VSDYANRPFIPPIREFLGSTLSLWNLVFLAGVFLGWLVFRPLARCEPGLRLAHPRFAVVVYLSALSAQLFAYAFDAHSSLLPPAGTGALAYYLDPLAGPKTLYGVIVAMPATLALATLGTSISLPRALDLWTRPMLTVLAVARVGCLLEGCCYGARSDLLGFRFPVGSPVYWQHRGDGLIGEGAAQSLPVVPTQLWEATVLAALALWCWRVAGHRGAQADGDLFLRAVTGYSVFRFVEEFVRADAGRGVYAGLATSQWIALAVLAVAAVVAAVRNSSTPRPAEAAPR